MAGARHRRGLVVGKFCPLHRGHMALIQAAIDACDEVVVISYTKPDFDGCGRAARARWLAALFPQVRALVLDDAALAALGDIRFKTLPANDADEALHREFCGWLCLHVLNVTVDAVFTSEDYGDGFAAALSNYFGAPVRHVCLDPARVAIPVSGTAIRADPYGQRRFLDPLVYASLVPRVCILGGESSGKTTMAAALAAALGTVWAPEYGRELWVEQGGVLTYADMLHIGEVQRAREGAMAAEARTWLICDTSPLVTMCYSEALFGAVDAALARLADCEYAATFVCAPSIPFVQDGTRQDDAFRWRQHAWYLAQLEQRGIAFTILEGDHATRLRTALAVLRRLRHSAPALHAPGDRRPQQA